MRYEGRNRDDSCPFVFRTEAHRYVPWRIERVPLPCRLMRAAFFPVLVSFSLSMYLTGASGSAEEIVRQVSGTRPLTAMPQDPAAFTFVVIPDTQSYLGKDCKHTPDSADPVTNPNLESQVNWILQHREDQRIAFVSHVGDIVDKNRPEEWDVARRHLDTMRGLVPFGLTVGNHDMKGDGNASLFQQYFPAASFKDYPWYLGSYTRPGENEAFSVNNVNSAQTFSAGGMDFLHLNLECNAPDDVVAWANALLTEHVDRRALITTHMDLGIIEKPKDQAGFIHDPKGRMRWTKNHGARGNNAEQLWEKLYRHHANLGLILSGDQSRVTALQEVRTGDHGNPVVSLLSDYLSLPVLRLMRFVPSANEIQVLTYDVKGEVLVDDTTYVHYLSSHQFSLPYPMGGPSQ